LCTLIENGSINLNTEASKITRIIGSILSDVNDGLDVASADTCERLMKILYEIQQQNPQGMQQAYAGLDYDVQNVLHAAIEDYAQSRTRVVTP
jgi:hypothetical protein